jgi:hypothetical protein
VKKKFQRMRAIQHHNRMITEGTSAATLGKMSGGSAIAIFGAAVSWMDHAEQLLRMGASVVAICSGVVVILVALKNSKHRKK